MAHSLQNTIFAAIPPCTLLYAPFVSLDRPDLLNFYCVLLEGQGTSIGSFSQPTAKVSEDAICERWKASYLACQHCSLSHSFNHQSVCSPSPNSDKASPLDICYRSISLDQQICSSLSFAVTVCVWWGGGGAGGAVWILLSSQHLLPSFTEKLTQQPLSGLLNFVMVDFLLPGVSSARAP